MSEVINKFQALCDSYELTIYALDSQIERVRNIHVPNPKYLGTVIPCVSCKETMPCPTIQAINGE